jgi:UDP:flavonoid glycosyltransferase YjiC (YdhE family)
MATIVYAMLNESGHLIPTFKLSRTLKTHGHRIIYLTDRHLQSYVDAQGFECLAIVNEVLQEQSSDVLGLDGANEKLLALRRRTVRIIEELNADLFIVDAFLPASAWVAVEAGFPSILLNTNLESHLPKTLLSNALTIRDEFGAAESRRLKVPEIILCPKDLDFPHTIKEFGRQYYAEPSVDLDRSEPPFDWSRIDPSSPLIYCSLGTQSYLYGRGNDLLQRVVDAMAANPRWQMVISIGHSFEKHAFKEVPPNVFLVDWAPQVELLKRSDIMITHGGLGTVKECISLGVPMIVIPLIRDQPHNAARVVYHGLGLRGDVRSVTPDQINTLIEHIYAVPTFKQKIETMRQKFRKAEAEQKSVKIIEKALEIIARKKASLKKPALSPDI